MFIQGATFIPDSRVIKGQSSQIVFFFFELARRDINKGGFEILRFEKSSTGLYIFKPKDILLQFEIQL